MSLPPEAFAYAMEAIKTRGPEALNDALREWKEAHAPSSVTGIPVNTEDPSSDRARETLPPAPEVLEAPSSVTGIHASTGDSGPARDRGPFFRLFKGFKGEDYNWLRRIRRQRYDVVCAECRETFDAVGRRKRYCSTRCRVAAWRHRGAW
jgi:hypothetical protein